MVFDFFSDCLGWSRICYGFLWIYGNFKREVKYSIRRYRVFGGLGGVSWSLVEEGVGDRDFRVVENWGFGVGFVCFCFGVRLGSFGGRVFVCI